MLDFVGANLAMVICVRVHCTPNRALAQLHYGQTKVSFWALLRSYCPISPALHVPSVIRSRIVNKLGSSGISGTVRPLLA